jgi:hypothetical protein
LRTPFHHTETPSFLETFIKKHIRSWQSHLERISNFLLPGKGSWWLEDESGNVEFLDGEKAASSHTRGPILHHFRSSSFSERKSTFKSVAMNA